MTRPECECQIGLFSANCKNKAVLRRKWKHIGWWCPVLKQWLRYNGKLWESHAEVKEYLKQWNKSISDIPEVENDKL